MENSDFQYEINGQEQPQKRYIQPHIQFFRASDWGDRNTIDFRDRMWVSIPDYREIYCLNAEFRKTWSFSEDDIRSMKTCTLKIYSGHQARYIWYTTGDRNEYRIRELAWQGYVPAMIAQAEIFRNTEWYNNAALMGSRHAQEKCGWQNGGLGFEIMPRNNGFMVWSAKKGLGVKKGMYLKTINGTAIPRNTDELSKLIGAFPPGESVTIEFTNEKKINITMQDK